MINVSCQKIRQFENRDRAMLRQMFSYLYFSRQALALGQKGKSNYK